MRVPSYGGARWCRHGSSCPVACEKNPSSAGRDCNCRSERPVSTVIDREQHPIRYPSRRIVSVIDGSQRRIRDETAGHGQRFSRFRSDGRDNGRPSSSPNGGRIGGRLVESVPLFDLCAGRPDTGETVRAGRSRAIDRLDLSGPSRTSCQVTCLAGSGRATLRCNPIRGEQRCRCRE